VFDEGELTEDPAGSERIINNLLSVMLPDRPRTSQQPVVAAHDDIFTRLAAVSLDHPPARCTQWS
jgi:hypothetical protein